MELTEEHTVQTNSGSVLYHNLACGIPKDYRRDPAKITRIFQDSNMQDGWFKDGDPDW